MNYLLSKGRVKHNTLAEEFDVSVKTIKEEIYELSAIFPLCTYQGRYGGVEISKSFTIGNRYFQTNEIKIIIRALILLKDSENNNTEIEKILSNLNDINKEGWYELFKKHHS